MLLLQSHCGEILEDQVSLILAYLEVGVYGYFNSCHHIFVINATISTMDDQADQIPLNNSS
jgi:hypothetical protein